jgi:formylglycine-generating enzyme required for sulfatase activity
LTSRYFGETEEYLPKYAWYEKNGQEQTWPVGRLKPNDWGLFDTQGDVWSWCQERYIEYPTGEGERVFEDKEDILIIDGGVSRVLRGGSFSNQPSLVRSAYRLNFVPTSRFNDLGFRPARTFR